MIARYEQKNNGCCTTVTKYKSLVNLPHWHVEQELVYVAVGNAEVMINNNLYRLAQGNSAFIAGEEIHYIKSEENSIIYVLKTSNFEIYNIVSQQRLLNPIVENSYPIKSILDNIYSEIRDKKKLFEIMADSLAVKLTAEIFRGEETTLTSISTDGINDKYKSLLKLISQKYKSITFDEAAEFMCLSRPYFSKYFHRISGMTFTHYLNIVRVSAATEMIIDRHMTMTAIAEGCGFGTIRSFNRVFKELMKCNPSEFPQNSSIVRSGKAENGFDPTLSCTVVLE